MTAPRPVPLPPRAQPRILATLLAAGSCTLAADGLHALVTGRFEALPGAYLAASSLLALLPALLAGLLLPRLPLAALAWAAAGGWLQAGPSAGVLLGLVAAGGVLLLERRGRPLPEIAVRSGGGLGLALLFGSRVAGPLRAALGAGLAEPLTSALLLGAVLLAPTPAPLRERARASTLAWAFLLALACAAPALLARSLSSRPPSLPHDLASTSPSPGPDRPHVVCIVLDTVRADHLSVYGHDRPTTPELERLLRERAGARLLPRAYANGAWTVPSHASLFTGLEPADHGAHFDLDGEPQVRFALAPGSPTLAAALREQGYATVGAYANHWLGVVEGLGAGFDRYALVRRRKVLPLIGEALRAALLPGFFPEVVKGGARAGAVSARLLAMIDDVRGDGPVFAFANYGDAHGPYVPPAGFHGRFAPRDLRERPEHVSIHQSPERRRLLEARYDEEILYLDSELGRLFDELERRGILDSAWVFVTSDHGEAFGEHGVTEHGTALYEEIVRIPLLVFPPAGPLDGPEPPAISDGPVSLVDVAATIAQVAGAPWSGPGRSLLDRAPERTVRIEFYGDPWKASVHGERAAHPARAVVRGAFKLLEDMRLGAELFEVGGPDPGERVDLAPAREALVRELSGQLPELRPSVRPDPEGATGGDELERALEELRRMGYAGGPP